MKKFLSIGIWVIIFLHGFAGAEDLSISLSGITVRYDEATRTVEIADDEAGTIFEKGVFRVENEGKTVSSDVQDPPWQVWVDADAYELSLELPEVVKVTLRLLDMPGIIVYAFGDDTEEVRFQARASAGGRAWPVILDGSQIEDNKVVFSRMGSAAIGPARSYFDPKHDLALQMDSAGGVRWQWQNGWNLHAKSELDQELLSVLFLRHYYRDRLGIKYYAPIVKRSFWETAPVVAMTWYGIEGWKKTQQKEWLYPQIDWVAEHLLPYAEKLVFQFDDHYAYQDDRYMRELSDYVRSKGLIPGIWFTPHGVAPKEAAEKQPEWFLHNDKGELLYAFAGKNWGWERQQTGVLNVQNAEAVRNWYQMFWEKTSETWNYDFFKIDGQPTVAQRYGQSADGGGVEGYRKSLRIGRRVVGPDKFINGCYGIDLDGVGILNGARTGPDTGNWPHAISIILRWNFLNNVVWWSDPDATANQFKATLERIRLNALARVLTGQQFLTDDVWTQVSPEKRRVWQLSFPMLDIYPVNLYPIKNWQDYDLYNLRIARPWGVWDIVGLFNYEGKSSQKFLDLSRLQLESDEVHLFEFWSSKYLGRYAKDARLTRYLKAYDAEAFAVVPANDERPVLLSTSRHISQGGVDLAKVRWQKSGRKWIVSGRSNHLVPGDEYEMVFVCGPYRIQSTESPDSPLNIVNGEGIARLRYMPQKNHSMDWKITFTPLEKAALTVAPERITLKPETTAKLNLKSMGPVGVNWQAFVSDPRIKISPATGSLGPWPVSTKLDVTVDTAGLKPRTTWTGEITIGTIDKKPTSRIIEVIVHSPPPENLARLAKATASSKWNNNHAAKYINDGRTDTRWNSAEGDKDGCWVELNWDKPVTFNQVVIDESVDWGKRIRAWRLEVGKDKPKTIAQGKSTVGRNFTIDLEETVTTDHLKLVLEKATVVPTIWELECYHQPR